MLRNCRFLSAEDKNLSEYLDFSVKPKKCFYDHKSDIFMCHDHQQNVTARARIYDPLRDQFDSAVFAYEKYFGKVNRFDKQQNTALLQNVTDILKESQRKRERELQSFISDSQIDEYVQKREKSRECAVYARIKRFGRKALFNRDKFQWFITITRDDKKFSTEDEWQKSLLRYLGNLADRYDVKFLGSFERGEEGDRLHFHAFVSLPDGALHKGFETVSRFSQKEKRWRTCLESIDFKNRFGNNEWDNISNVSCEEFHRTFCYMTKYVTKQPVRFYYSRHLPSEVLRYVSFENVYFTGTDTIQKWFVTSPDDLLDDVTVPLHVDILGPPKLIF